jgi:hypothetical protein
VRNQADVLIQGAGAGAFRGGVLTAGGAKVAEMVGATDRFSWPVTTGGAVIGAAWEVGKQLRDIANIVAEADMVIIWNHPGVQALGSVVPTQWLNLAHLGNRWLE